MQHAKISGVRIENKNLDMTSGSLKKSFVIMGVWVVTGLCFISSIDKFFN